jgi:dTDP-L-rhamnose 4-epimerase
MTLLFARTIGLDAFALRYQNVYGPGQSLRNPYTGLLTTFFNQARLDETINVFEDGAESRDFLHLDDAVGATMSCLRPDTSGVHALNVGSGERVTILAVAQAVVRRMRSKSPIRITGDFRVGDIRHCLADISRIRRTTGFAPSKSFNEGVGSFLDWAEVQDDSGTDYDKCMDELRQRALFGTSVVP